MSNEFMKHFCYLLWDIYNTPELKALSPSSTNPTAIQYVSVVLSILTCVIGLVGNVIVIYVTGFLMKNNKFKIFFLNMAVADFVFLLVLPLNAVSVLRVNWPFGSHVCKLYNFLFLVNMYASIYIITALNIDRALSVAKPIWHRKFISWRFSFTVCALIWVIATLGGIPAIIYSYEFADDGAMKQCTLFTGDITRIALIYDSNSSSLINLQSTPRDVCDTVLEYEDVVLAWKQTVSSAKSFVISLAVIGYLIPLIVIISSNVIIAINVKNYRVMASSRLYRLIVTVVLVFFFTRTPLVLAQIMYPEEADILQLTLMYKVIVFLPLLSSIAAINSGLNPVIYVLQGNQVRTLIKESFNRHNPFSHT